MAPRPMDFDVRLEFGTPGVAQRASVNLRRVLGVRPLEHDWRGHPSFSFPAPFAHVRIAHKDTIRGWQAFEVLAAIRFFTQLES